MDERRAVCSADGGDLQLLDIEHAGFAEPREEPNPPRFSVRVEDSRFPQHWNVGDHNVVGMVEDAIEVPSRIALAHAWIR